MKNKTLKNLLSITLLILIPMQFSSCKLLKEMSSFACCEFRLSSVDNIRLAGVNVQNIRNYNQLSASNVASLMRAVSENRFPLELTLNLDARNPNPSTATLNRLDWILLIDDIEMTEGSTQRTISIPPNGGTTTFPLGFSFDLKQVLSGRSADALINFGLNLAGAGNKPTRFTLRAKPHIIVNNIPFAYPGYLNIKTDFVSGS